MAQEAAGYWCHVCGKAPSRIVRRPDEEIECFDCKQTFVEDQSLRDEEPVPAPGSQPAPPRRITRVRVRRRVEANPFEILFGTMPLGHSEGGFGPRQMLQMLGMGMGGRGGGDPVVMGDYVAGPLDGLLHSLMMAGGNRGPPPTKKSVIDALPVIPFEDIEGSESTECPVCQDKFSADSPEMTKLECTCSRCFHKECLVPWLKEHNTCPVCRFELPT